MFLTLSLGLAGEEEMRKRKEEMEEQVLFFVIDEWAPSPLLHGRPHRPREQTRAHQAGLGSHSPLCGNMT